MASGPNTKAIADAIKALLDGTAFFQQTYEDMPDTFGGQSPVAVITPTLIIADRYTSGAGVHKDKLVWTIDVYINRQDQTYDVAVGQLYTALDVLRPLFHGHYALGQTTGSILVAMLDNETIRTAWHKVEGVQYRVLSIPLCVYEEYTTAVVA
jgi:hypothetical protein